MRTPHGMQGQTEEGVRSVTEQGLQQEVERLRSESEQQRSILEECLAHIDQSILTCRAQINEYRQTRSDLVALNERLVNLGAESVAVPDHLPAENLEDLILACLQRLSAKGRS
jgi:hypothetical protein